jgi:UDP-2-acetamido-2-deoxy-ribo-hexuluronate aminotransferase
MEFIDLKAQRRRIRENLDRRMNAVLDHGQFIMGPEVKELEDRLAAFTSAKHAIACANGTDALQIALMALDIKPGDQVITTAFSFFATVETILLLGAEPVFVDIDARTYNMDPTLIESKITSKTKAIIPVSLYGQCYDFDAIHSLAKKHNIPVIEDAAQSFGASYKGRRSCSQAAISCTSFFPSKPLGCYGDGGALFTNDDAMAARLKEIRVHGQRGRYHHASLGVNSRLDTLQAAVLLAKLDIFETEIAERQEVAARYHQGLKGVVQTPFIGEGHISAYAQFTIEVKNREQVMAHLKELGVPTVVHYPQPMHIQPAALAQFPQVRSTTAPKAEHAAAHVMSLPFSPYLTIQDQTKVIESLKKVLA